MNNPDWWQTLVETALLGTERRPFDPGPLPPDLQTALPPATPEQALLQTAALATNYLRAGRLPATIPLPDLPGCPAETKLYAPSAALSLLTKILNDPTPNRRLLGFWLGRCAGRQWLIPPSTVPTLLDLMAKPLYADCRDALRTVVGERGQWLSQFNKNWAYLDRTDPETNWYEGAGADRLAAWQHLRLTNPARAVELLRESWPAESARDRIRWMSVLAEKAMPTDVAFAGEVLAELDAVKKPTATQRDLRTQTVAVLLDSPDSALFRDTRAALASYVITKRELLINRVTVLLLPGRPDAFFNEKTMSGYGFDSDAALTDDQQLKHWLNNLLTSMHPSVWTTLFAVGYEPLAGVLKRQNWFTGKSVMHFATAIIRHQVEPVARELLSSVSEYQRARLLAIVPQPLREDRLMGSDAFLKSLEEYSYLTAVGAPGWSREFSQWLAQELASALYYQFSGSQRQFLSDSVLVVHPAVDLTRLAPFNKEATYAGYGQSILQNHLTDPLTRWLALRRQISEL